MKLGIGTYTYMWSIGFPGAEPPYPMSAFDLLAKAREFGVRVVQYGPNLPLDSLPEAQLDDLLCRAQRDEIEIEVGTIGLDPQHLARQVEFARRAGARLLRTVSDYDRRQAPPSASDLCRALEPLAPQCEAAGVAVAIENATIPATILAEALDRIGSPWLGITLDTVNSLAIAEGTEQVARTLARFTLCLHIKDFAIDRVGHVMGFTIEGRPAGKGQLDIPWLLGLLRDAGRSPNAILELWTPRQRTLEETIALEQSWAVESTLYLRRFIPE